MSDLGNCPECGTPYGVRRRCYRCRPARMNRSADPTPGEIDALKAEIRGGRGDEMPMASDPRELLRARMADRAAEERREVREERETPRPRVATDPPLPPLVTRVEPDTSRRPAPATIDPEIAAIAAIFDTLTGFDERARDRVLCYVRDRFQAGS